MKTKWNFLMVLALLVMSLATASPGGATTTIIYVKAGATGANNGTSWANAYTSLQSALGAANPAEGDTVQIWVAAGTYKPGVSGNTTATFQLKKGVEIYGGFAGTEGALSERALSTNVTTLSGDLDDSGTHTANDALHVVTGSNTNPTAILDGFTITFGNGPTSDGGGVFIASGSPTLRNLTIYDNHAYRGAGVYIDQSDLAGDPTTLTNVVFRSNSTTTEFGMGGGLCVVSGSATLTNVTVYGNSAYQGGGLYAATGGYGSYTLVNSIVWGNTATSAFPQLYLGTVSYSIVEGGRSGTGNSGADPQFVNAASGDLHLQAGSPAIDAGNNGAVPSGVTIDRDGNARFLDDTGKNDTGFGTPPFVDKGAYEFQGFTPTTVTINQAAGQPDPTGVAPIIFSVIFSIPVSDFETGDVALSGTAGANKAVVTGSGTTYNVAVSGMTQAGTVIADIPANAAHDAGGHGNLASTSTDNVVTYGGCATTGILYVDASAAGANDGTSWANAYTSLQSALFGACPGAYQTAQIWVKAGTYKPTIGTDRGPSFQLKDKVEIYGGFAGGETDLSQRDWQANATILSGDVDGTPGASPYDSHHVVAAIGTGTSAILDGFTVTSGCDRESISGDAGGLMVQGASPTLRNLVISDNIGYYGGGMSVGGGGSPWLTNVTFSDNEAHDGAGLFADGAGVDLRLTNVAFRGNHATYQAGGMGLWNSNAFLTNVLFSGNVAELGTGGMIAYPTGDDLVVLNNVTFSGNYGTGVNSAGGLAVWGNLAMGNSILWNNANSGSSSSISLGFTNYTVRIDNSDIQGGCPLSDKVTCDVGSINADPLFVDPIAPSATASTGGDYSLSACSPAIDAGDNLYVSLEGMTDLNGDARLVDDPWTPDTGIGTAPIVDMGAYEYQFDPNTDTDGDGVPDLSDGCMSDSNKTAPGVCGCGVPDTDTDRDGIADCIDNCPAKRNPKQTDSDGDGVGDACDLCPADAAKTEPGACGCGVPDTDTDGDGAADCIDQCPADATKTEPGLCGCGVPEGECPVPTLHVASITVTTRTGKQGSSATGVVTIVDEAGNPVSGAVVYATWTFPDGTKLSQQATTSRTGAATFRGARDGNGTYQLCVDDVTKSGYDYLPAQNAETCEPAAP